MTVFRSTGFNRGKTFKAGGFYILRGEIVLDQNQDVPPNRRMLEGFAVYPVDEVPTDVVGLEARIDDGSLVEASKNSATPGEIRMTEQTHDMRAIDPEQRVADLAALDPKVNPLAARDIGLSRAHLARVQQAERGESSARAESPPREDATPAAKKLTDLPGVSATK